MIKLRLAPIISAYFFLLTISIASNSAPFFAEQKTLLEQLPLKVIGEVVDADTKETIYREYHYWNVGGEKHLVLYKDMNDQLIAEKLLESKGLATSPDMSQRNYLSGEEILVSFNNDEAQFNVSYQPSSGKPQETIALKDSGDLVIDAGFNHYIEEQWDILSKGKRREFDYLVPSRQTLYRFFAEQVPCEKSYSDDIETLCIKIAPSSWWLRRFVEPIHLVYRRQDRQLLRYAGLGNIGDEQGDYPEIEINYQYR